VPPAAAAAAAAAVFRRQTAQRCELPSLPFVSASNTTPPSPFQTLCPPPPLPCRSFSFAFTRYLSPSPCCTDAHLSRIPVSSVGPSRLLLSVIARRKRLENVPWSAVWPTTRVGVDMQSCLRWRVFFSVMSGLIRYYQWQKVVTAANMAFRAEIFDLQVCVLLCSAHTRG
jgi:hypothetical protein